MSAIETGTGTDYLYRATAPKAAVSRAIADAITDITYPNFKDAVGYDDLDRSRAYHNVWGSLYALQKRNVHGW